MDLSSLSLPDWLPWWGVVGLLVPAALYLALFLMMPFSTFGLRGRLRELEMRLDAVHEEVRSLTLRLPERGGADMYAGRSPMDQPPIPPAPREAGSREVGPRSGFGDPVADRMLAYMREKAQSELQRAEQPRVAPRPRAEPRFIPPSREAAMREPDLPLPPPVAGLPGGPPSERDYPPDAAAPPRPPRLPARFGRRPPDGDPG